ncbi:universal stress protein [Chloroflexota bacterium]
MSLSWEEHVSYIKNHFEKICRRYLTSVKKRLKKTSLEVTTKVLMGNPANEIIEYTNKNHLNLIAMTTHSRSGVSRWAYGSITDRVLYGVSSPVFLASPPFPIWVNPDRS